MSACDTAGRTLWCSVEEDSLRRHVSGLFPSNSANRVIWQLERRNNCKQRACSAMILGLTAIFTVARRDKKTNPRHIPSDWQSSSSQTIKGCNSFLWWILQRISCAIRCISLENYWKTNFSIGYKMHCETYQESIASFNHMTVPLRRVH